MNQTGKENPPALDKPETTALVLHAPAPSSFDTLAALATQDEGEG